MPEWTEASLQQLVTDQVQESLTLDYKESAALDRTERNRNELAKDVSAFANSAGGTLIYGMAEDGHLPRGLDQGFNPTEITREWIEQVLRSRVQPAIPDITITSVPLTAAAPGRVAYVIDVAQGVTAHQAPDRKYYKRLNFASEPMPDYEIRDVMHRGERPLVEAVFGYLSQQQEPHVHVYQLTIELQNLGALIVDRLQLRFTLPHITEPPFKGFRVRILPATQGTSYPVDEFSFTSVDRPLFPQERVSLVEWGIVPPMYRIDQQAHDLLFHNECELRWTMYADNMRRREGIVPMDKLHEF